MAYVHDDVDLSNCNELQRRLVEVGREQPDLIVSLEECSYCDTSAIASFLALQKTLSKTRLVFVIPQRSGILRTLSIAGLLYRFDVSETVDDAVKKLVGDDGLEPPTPSV